MQFEQKGQGGESTSLDYSVVICINTVEFILVCELIFLLQGEDGFLPSLAVQWYACTLHLSQLPWQRQFCHSQTLKCVCSPLFL